MRKSDWVLHALLALIVLLLGVIAIRPYVAPPSVMAQPAKFDHVFIMAGLYLYKGQHGMLVLDQRNANVWFFPKVHEQYQDPVFLLRLPFEKLDQAHP